jgi:predicted ATPase
MVTGRADRGALSLAGLKQELTLAKVAAGVGIGVLGTFLSWLISRPFKEISLGRYLWPWGVLVFLLLVVLLLGVDNARLRFRRKASKPPHEETARQQVHALDPSSVIGRDQEIDEVVAFVRSDDRKFLCLYGPGGVGKTTVARAALARLADIRTGFVDVTAVEERGRDPSAVDQAFAVAVATHGLGVPLVGREPPVACVANSLQLLTTPTVLVIDNVEQVAGRAAPIIHDWVLQSPLARVIVTSRVELEVGTERLLEIGVFNLHPLDLDPVVALRDPGPAIELFRRRRSDRLPSFGLDEQNIRRVNSICHAVGGLALGIELAAAVRRSLAEIEVGISERSDFLASSRADLPLRQRSLAAAIDWSLQLLEPDAYSLVLQLSVAPGELDDDAIARIARLPAGARPLEELVSQLVGAQLLVRKERGERSTYRQRIEVRRRCAERRRKSTRDEDRSAWSRFAGEFMKRAEDAESERYGPRLGPALDRLERDYDNLLAVVQRAEPTDPTVAARAALPLEWMVAIRRPAEPRRKTLTSLEASVPSDQRVLLTRLRTAISAICWERWVRFGEPLRDPTRDWSDRALEAADGIDDHLAIGQAYRQRAVVAFHANQPDNAAAALESAVGHFVQARQFAAVADAYALWTQLPPVGAHKDKLEEAKRALPAGGSQWAEYQVLTAEFNLWQQSSQASRSIDMRRITGELRRLAEDIGSPVLLSQALHASALLESELGAQDRALEAFRAKADLERAAGSTVALGMTMNAMAATLLRREPVSNKDLDEAIRLLDEALPLVEGRGLGWQLAYVRSNRGLALLQRGRPKEAQMDSTAAVAYFEELLAFDRPSAFIHAIAHVQILAAVGDTQGAAMWAEKAKQLATQAGFGEASTSQEIRRRAKWLRQYQSERDHRVAGGRDS